MGGSYPYFKKLCENKYRVHSKVATRVGHSQKFIKPCEKECKVCLFICEKIYTILRYNEGPLQLQSCLYKKLWVPYIMHHLI